MISARADEPVVVGNVHSHLQIESDGVKSSIWPLIPFGYLDFATSDPLFMAAVFKNSGILQSSALCGAKKLALYNVSFKLLDSLFSSPFSFARIHKRSSISAQLPFHFQCLRARIDT